MDGDFENRLFAVALDGNGSFHGQGGCPIPQFFDMHRQLLEAGNVPPGSWPFLFQTTSLGGYLYFSYFLSRTIQRWELAKDGYRLSASSGDLGLVEQFLQLEIERDQNNFDAIWLQHKLIKKNVNLAYVDSTKLTRFYKMECDACEAIATSDGIDRARRVANIILRKSDTPMSNHDGIRFSDVPKGYREPFFIAGRQGHSLVRTNDLDIDPIVKLGRIIEELDLLAQASCMSIVLHELTDDHHLNVTVRVPGLATDEYARPVLLLSVSVDLIARVNQNTSIHPAYARLQPSLRSLLYYIAGFAEKNTKVCDLKFSLGDEGEPDYLSFDRPIGSKIPLIPDIYMIQGAEKKHHYFKFAFSSFYHEFEHRKPLLFWRGATTGRPFIGNAAPVDAFMKNSRIVACLQVKKTLGEMGDAKITRIVQMPASAIDAARNYAIEHGIWGQPVSEEQFGKYQVYLDLPGNSCAWGTFRKFLLGCLVVRPTSANELFYHSALKPSLNYLEVAADLSDLYEIMIWIRENQRKAAEIAYAGRLMMIDAINNLDISIQNVFRREARTVAPSNNGFGADVKRLQDSDPMLLSPVSVISFNRPDLLKQTLQSLAMQIPRIDGSRMHLFQDGARSGAGANQAAEKACIGIFKEIFPKGCVHVAESNLGIGLNINRAEEFVFEDLSANVGFFFEDDMVLSPHYMATLNTIAKIAMQSDRIGYFAAYGNHHASPEQQFQNRHSLIGMHHLWGFGLTRRHWLKQRPIIERYLKLIKGRPYSARPAAEIQAYFVELGFPRFETSQDAAKILATMKLGCVRLTCYPSFGHYVGKVGTHFTQEIYDAYGFGSTILYPREIDSIETPSDDEISRIFRNNVKDNLQHAIKFYSTTADPGNTTLDNGRIISTLYKGILDRNPDGGAYKYFLGRLSAGTITVEGLIRILVESAEFREKLRSLRGQYSGEPVV